jgi:phosphatidate phosphatase PAH1
LIAIIPEFQVDIEVNEVPVTIHMKLDDNGAAYFVELIDSDEEDEEMSPGNV